MRARLMFPPAHVNNNQSMSSSYRTSAFPSTEGREILKGVPAIGLVPESPCYFDYHHSDNDTIEKVNERELELGAAAMAIMAYLISEEF